MGALVVLLGALVGGPPPREAGAQDHRSTRVLAAQTQPWGKPVETTMCADWSTAMTTEQQWTMAETLLESSWKLDRVEDFPTDGLVTIFASTISRACDGQDFMVWPLAASLYDMERPAFLP